MGSKNTKINSKLDYFCHLYVQIIEEIIDGKNFSTNKMILMVLITQYINFYNKYNILNENLFENAIKHTKFHVIHQIHKLHSYEYHHKLEINPVQLFKWCIDEYQFCISVYPLLRKFNYQKWYKKYELFLRFSKGNMNKHPKPKLEQIFMWHCHMLDHTNYIKDIINIFSYIPYNTELCPMT